MMRSNAIVILGTLLLLDLSSGFLTSSSIRSSMKTSSITSKLSSSTDSKSLSSSSSSVDENANSQLEDTIVDSSSDSSKTLWLQSSLEKMSPPVVGPQRVLIYDTTLRDGTQGESVSASCDDKLKISQRLVDFGVDFIEAGWPGSNPKDAEFFERAKTELKGRDKLVAFGSTRRKNIKAEDDKQIKALLDSEAPTICIVAKSSKWQVEEILRATPEENIEMIYDSVKYLVDQGRQVMVDLEHFFDGFQQDPEYVLRCCEAATDAGATCLVLCDTNGGTMPWEVYEATQKIHKHFVGHITVGVHAHNDCGMAVANSMMAAKAGAGLIQGTVNGLGERTGNANLCSIVPSLALHVESKLGCVDSLQDLTTLSRFVDELLNRTPDSAAPFVGTSAFAHKGGLHVAAMERNAMSYQHIDPSKVGNEQRTLISELAGRQNIVGKMKDIGLPEEEASSERAIAILNRVKELEARGYTFEGADASVHLMILHASKGYCPPFRVLDYSAQVHDNNIDSANRVLDKFQRQKDPGTIGTTARATIKVRTLDLNEENYQGFDSGLLYQDHLEVSDGQGPVDALSKALKKALLPSHPYVGSLELVDYKVRILDPESATGAATRVMIEFRDGDSTWSTVSVDRNIISASVNALVDGFEYALIEHASACMLCDDAY